MARNKELFVDEAVDVIHKFGVSAVTTGAPCDIYRGALAGVAYPFPAAAATLNVAGASVNDTSAGTGARTLLLDGLDADFARITETVVLTGQTVKATTQTFLRVHRAQVVTAGAVGTNDDVLVASMDNGSPVAITAATATDPAVFTSAGHGLVDGDRVILTGMAGGTWSTLNNRIFEVDDAAATFTLNEVNDVVGVGIDVDASTLGVWSAGNFTKQDSLVQIGDGDGQTLMAIYTVPVNRRLEILSLYSSYDANNTQQMTVFIRDASSATPAWRALQRWHRRSGETRWNFPEEIPLVIPEKYDVRMVVEVAATGDVSAGFNGCLRDLTPG